MSSVFLKRKILENKILLLIIFIYFFLRFINLTKPPLFNDEAIYLDWGYREIHVPGFLYYSLYDGKQPFLMWIFGIFETFFNPSVSGRIVSVFAGALTLLGLYKISKAIFNEKVALLSSFFYVILPIFSFYDRQALMESSIAAVGIWSFYFLIKALRSTNSKYSIFLGLVLGVGFLIKSTSLLFFISSLTVILFYSFYKEEKFKFIEKSFLLISTFFLSNILLFINPQFWSTLGKSSRYIFTIQELLTFPLSLWIRNFFANLEISFIYLTPLISLALLIGIFLTFKNKELDKRIFIFYFILAFFLESFTVRLSSERYLVSFLPFISIFVAVFLYEIFKKNSLLGKISFLMLSLLPLLVTTVQILDQPTYFLFTGKFTKFNHADYLNSFSSGYGVDEAIKYIKYLSNGKHIIIGLAENTGNPESAVLAYFANDKNIKPAYLDIKLIPQAFGYDCLKTPTLTYFIARDNQQGGLDKFFEKINTIKNPYGENTIGIYRLKANCKGKTLQLIPALNST